VVTTDGPDRLGLVARLSECIGQARANISASKIITIGDDIAFMLVVSAPVEVVDALAQALRAAGAKFGLTVNTSRIENVSDATALDGGPPRKMRRHSSGPHLARVELIGNDSPGLVSMVASFLERHELSIQSLDSRVYSGASLDARAFASAGARACGAEPEDAAADGAATAGARPKLRTRPTEMGKSRGLQSRAEGDQFSLSAIVSTALAPDVDLMAKEIARLERAHGVHLRIHWMDADEAPGH
jgi:glycine cleavage system regulatory protein